MQEGFDQLNLFDDLAVENAPPAPAADAAPGPAEEIRELLEAARVEKGLTKAEVARSMGRDPAALRKLLTADGFNPELKTLVGLAEAVGMVVRVERRRRGYVRRT